ncbi:hypothetical protein BX600DRAFT_501124 [Xylariales sp. PMI_506]|nr:hypothetical protein BX600DRAFT_501124 [Xylariales sp. PMI_506]
MKATFAASILFSLVAFTAANPIHQDESPALLAAKAILDTRGSCSGDRGDGDVCGGKKLQPQNSFHNCGNSGGKCCALNADGSGGINVNQGGGENCGYCFSGKCKS